MTTLGHFLFQINGRKSILKKIWFILFIHIYWKWQISSFKVISHVWQKVVFFLNIFLIRKMLKIGNTPWQILRRLPSQVLLKPNTSISFLLVYGGGEKLNLLTGSISRECRRYILFQEKNKRAPVFVPYFSPLYLTPISPTPSSKEKNRAGIKRNCSWH